MFLDAYKRNWLETEGYSFEDKMIDDLSVSCDRSSSELSSRYECLWILTMLILPATNKSESHGGRGGRGRGDREEA